MKTITSSLGDGQSDRCRREYGRGGDTLGEHSRAIELLSHLAHISYSGWLCGNPVTPAALQLDPIWDRCAAIAFKLCQDKRNGLAKVSLPS